MLEEYPRYDRPIEELEAGNNFRNSLVGRADGRRGCAPLWHGWAIMDAFLAGIDYAQESARRGPMTCIAGTTINSEACPKCGATIDEGCRSPLVIALLAARPYVQTCADDTLPNPAAKVLHQIDALLA
jgi:hypothetical protein